MKKNLFLIILLFILFAPVFAEKTGNYIVTLNNDTVEIDFVKWNYRRIICKVNGKRTKYLAKNILAYKVGNEIGEGGLICPIVIGFKRWIFLEREMTGKVNVYSITVNQKNASIIESSKVLPNYTYSSSNVTFYRKQGEPRGKYHKLISWRRLDRFLSDCPAYVEKLHSKETFTTLQEEINFYNSKCN